MTFRSCVLQFLGCLALLACSEPAAPAISDAGPDVFVKIRDAGPDADDGSIDAPGCTLCADACADLATDKSNCGGCGSDCTGGACAGGVCTLADLDASLTCLAIYNQNVYVTAAFAADAGAAYAVPTNGGAATVASTTNLPAGAIAADTSDAYWGEWNGFVTYLHDALSPTWMADNMGMAKYGASPVVHSLAINQQYVAWLDESGNLVTTTRQGASHAATLYVSEPGTGYLAMGGTSAFVSGGSGNSGTLCEVALPSSNAPNCQLLQGAAVGPVAVDDSNGATPTIFFAIPSTVMSAKAVNGKWSIFADQGPGTIRAMTYVDPQTLYLTGSSGVYKTAAGHVVPFVPNAHPTGRCLASDAQAIYWIEGSRVRKAPR